MVQKAKILLADDDWEDQFFMAEAFKEIGQQQAIHIVENGIEVIDYLEQQPDKKSLPQLIVLDLNMPKMNGTSTLKAIKKNLKYAHIAVIIFSTSINEIEKEECLRMGALAYIAKPSKHIEYLHIAHLFCDFDPRFPGLL